MFQHFTHIYAKKLRLDVKLTISNIIFEINKLFFANIKFVFHVYL